MGWGVTFNPYAQFKSALESGCGLLVRVDGVLCVPRMPSAATLVEIKLKPGRGYAAADVSERGFIADLDGVRLEVPWSAVVSIEPTPIKPLAKTGPQLDMFASTPDPDPMLAYRQRVDADIDFIGAAATLQKRWALEESEKAWAEQDTDPRRPGVFSPGDQLVYTAKFLQQVNCALDIPKVFTAQECSCELCALGNHVCTTEWSAGYDMFKHVSRAAVRHKGAMHVDDLPVGLQRLISPPHTGNTRWLNRADRKALGLEVDE